MAKEKRSPPARIYIQVACDNMATKLGLEVPVITQHIANMVCNVAILAHNRTNLLSGYSPFLFPNLTATEAQQLVSNLQVWGTHLTDGSRSNMAETKQAA